ncbi:endo alpha-1,4 polygalactosaminidase [soil metagenome]
MFTMLLSAACGSGGSATLPSDVAAGVKLPPTNAKLDYQIGGAYTPPTGVMIVSRDRTATPASGPSHICYITGFPTQPDKASIWMTQHSDLILRDNNGAPVIDADWNEMLIDVSTPAKRTAVAAIVAGWIDGCKTAGFDAIEIDNLDSYSRSGGRLTEDSAVAAMTLFSASAHGKGLAIAQKNSAEIVGRHSEMSTDFAVAEECNTFDECGDYVAGYGDHVLVIEYVRADFTKGCTRFPGLSIVLRDRNLVAPGASAYVYDGC